MLQRLCQQLVWAHLVALIADALVSPESLCSSQPFALSRSGLAQALGNSDAHLVRQLRLESLEHGMTAIMPKDQTLRLASTTCLSQSYGFRLAAATKFLHLRAETVKTCQSENSRRESSCLYSLFHGVTISVTPPRELVLSHGLAGSTPIMLKHRSAPPSGHVIQHACQHTSSHHPRAHCRRA